MALLTATRGRGGGLPRGSLIVDRSHPLGVGCVGFCVVDGLRLRDCRWGGALDGVVADDAKMQAAAATYVRDLPLMALAPGYYVASVPHSDLYKPTEKMSLVFEGGVSIH